MILVTVKGANVHLVYLLCFALHCFAWHLYYEKALQSADDIHSKVIILQFVNGYIYILA